jgi:uncharacterized protein with von Willebrand factor type A (vWA) domain
VTPAPAFGVETIHLDLPPLVGALSTRLRAAGVPVTPERAAGFARALDVVRPISRQRLYWTARAVFVSDEAHAGAFDAVFRATFGAPAQGPVRPDVPVVAVEQGPPLAGRGVSPRRSAGDRPASGEAAAGDAGGEGPDADVPLAIASDEEQLGSRSFDTLDADELARLHRLMSRLELATPDRRTRRHVKGRRGRRTDLRRTLRTSLRSGGDPVRLERRRRRVERRRLVMLCDISGSMEPYARAYLQLLACAVGSGPRAEAFAFATRLTRLTRPLASGRADQAIQRAAATAPDWSSGTRIGDALKTFNDVHGRRGMARGAVVVIISDGWERGDPALVGREMERLSLLAHRIVWVNPRVSASSFSTRAGGMRAALPFCDALVSGHSFDALAEVAEAIGGGEVTAPEPEAEPEEETWASATPEPGSSVAMPSGYGPSRGNTSPGWSLGK